jgi:MFS family permease
LAPNNDDGAADIANPRRPSKYEKRARRAARHTRFPLAHRFMSESFKSKPIVRVWRNRNFTLYESGMTLYSVTGWMQRVGVGWLAWELTHSTFWLGVVAAADLGPMILLAPFAGAVADRVDSWKLSRASQFLLMMQAVALAGLIFTNTLGIYTLLGVSIYSGILYPFSGAARQTLLPRTVPHAEFATAIALDSAAFQAARFVGPALASIVIPTFGVAAAFVIHGCGSVIFQTAIAFMRLEPDKPRDRKHRNIFRDVGESFSYVRGHVGIGSVFFIMVIASIIIRPVQDMLPGFAGGVFHGGARELAFLTSSMGVGALVSAATIAARGGVSGLTSRVFMGFLGLSLATFSLVATENLVVGVIGSALVGYTLNSMSTSTQALVQTAVDPDMRGRVMSLYLLIFRGMPAVGSLLDGFIAHFVGLRWTFAVGATLCALLWLLTMPRRHKIAESLEGPRPKSSRAFRA